MKKFLLFFLIIGWPFFIYSQPFQPNYKSSFNNPTAVHTLRATTNPLFDEYDIKFYWLDLEMYRGSNFLSGNVLITSQVVADYMYVFAFELSDTFSIDSIIFKSNKLVFNRSGDTVFSNLGTVIYKYDVIEVRIYYHGNTTLSEKDFNTGMPVAFTDSEPFDATSFFPCKMDLNDKADSSWFFITTSSDCKAGSNGLLTNVVNLGNGKTRYEWKSRYPIDYYLIAAAVSKYREYSFRVKIHGLKDSVLVQNYIYDTIFYKDGNPYEYLDYNKAALNSTADAMTLYSGLFGYYPFHDEKYGHCAVPLWGAMENQTITFSGIFKPYIVAHELSHHWFGDLVTCKTWSDIWVNEGFADYCEYLYEDQFLPDHKADTLMNGKHNYIMSQPGGSVYVPENQAMIPARIFDGRLSYNKGGAILHLLRFEIDNDSLFFLAIRSYLYKYKFGTATALNFKEVVEQITGMDLTTFFNLWYFGEGYPVYNIEYTQYNDTFYMRSEQQSSMNPDSFFRMKMEVMIYAGNKEKIITFYQDHKTEYLKIAYSPSVDSIRLDPFIKTFEKVNITRSGIDQPGDIYQALKIFPNPAGDILYLCFLTVPQNIYTYRITDLSGKTIKEAVLSFPDEGISLQGMASGTYLLTFITGNSHFTALFVKD